MSILFSAHQDDESLFACYTIMREKPLVVVVYDGYQHQRKFNIGVNVRRNESIMAMKLLGVNVEFMGLSDDENYDQY
jgi:LmbE family N-acetylglucosaminyl deacetylase